MTRARTIIALCLFLPACAAQNRATGTVAGKDFQAEVIDAKYCDHCSGGTEISVTFRSPLGAAHSGLLLLTTQTCVDRPNKLRIGKGDRGQARLAFSDDRGGDSRNAVEGEVAVDECNSGYFDATFWGKFADGSRLSGSISTKLEYDAGYD